jgi:hypothetical protein
VSGILNSSLELPHQPWFNPLQNGSHCLAAVRFCLVFENENSNKNLKSKTHWRSVAVANAISNVALKIVISTKLCYDIYVLQRCCAWLYCCR